VVDSSCSFSLRLLSLSRRWFEQITETASAAISLDLDFKEAESAATADRMERKYGKAAFGLARIAVTLMTIVGMSLCSQGQPQN